MRKMKMLLKNMLIIIAMFIASVTVFNISVNGQKYENGVYTSSTGFQVKVGDKLKVGVGSSPDGYFNYIRKASTSVMSLMRAINSNPNNGRTDASKNSLAAKYSGQYIEVSKIWAEGSKKHGYVYYVNCKVGGGEVERYEVDIENAISRGEVEVPDEFKPKSLKPQTTVVEVKQQGNNMSVADELAKLKKLKDDGVLTQEEFDAAKKKLLEKN